MGVDVRATGAYRGAMATPRMTPNQVVAHNLRRARGLLELTQEEAAERLEPFLGERWSRVVFSAAERSVSGKRVRQFDADDLVAFAAAFELPISFFLDAPRSATVAAPRAREGLSTEQLRDLATGDPRTAVTRIVEAHYDQHGIAYQPAEADRSAIREEES
jgi:hypothetical protein